MEWNNRMIFAENYHVFPMQYINMYINTFKKMKE